MDRPNVGPTLGAGSALIPRTAPQLPGGRGPIGDSAYFDNRAVVAGAKLSFKYLAIAKNPADLGAIARHKISRFWLLDRLRLPGHVSRRPLALTSSEC